MAKQSNFFSLVYEIASLVPYGRVTSYGAIAHSIGLKTSARMVGYAMNDSSKSDKTVNAHRVVNRNGVLTGKHHFGPRDEMKELLEAEGHKIVNDKIENFESVFWDPQIELNLNI